jgi:hypothetical protein
MVEQGPALISRRCAGRSRVDDSACVFFGQSICELMQTLGRIAGDGPYARTECDLDDITVEPLVRRIVRLVLAFNGKQWDGRPHPQFNEPAKVAVSPTT